MEWHPESARQTALEWLSESWAASLARALSAMSGENPSVEWSAEPAPAQDGDEEGALWWAQEFDLVDGTALWIGLPQRTWTLIGARPMCAAGVREGQPAEARNTTLEILSQAFPALAQAIGGRLQRPVCTGGGMETQGPPPAVALRSALIRFPDADPAPFQIGFSPALTAALEPPAPEPAPADSPSACGRQVLASQTLDLLREVELPVSVSFGRARMALGDVLKLNTGSIIELDRAIHEPVSLIVNETVVALGEVVVIEGNYGLRIQQVMSRDRLLRSSGLR